MRGNCIAVAGTALGLLGYPAVGHAYRTAGDTEALASDVPVAWRDTVIDFRLTTPLPAGLDAADVHRAFEDAAFAWGALGCEGPRLQLASGTFGAPAVAGDGWNTLGFVAGDELPGDVPADAPGITDVQYERTGTGPFEIVEADIYLSLDASWSAADAGAGATDLKTVLIHELGHTLGLLHNCETDGKDGAPDCATDDEEFSASVMYPRYEMAQAFPADDDRDGYCFLYPGDACTVDMSCAPQDAGTCDGGACGRGPTLLRSPEPACDGGACASCEADAGEGECGGAGDKAFGDLCEHGGDCASALCVAGYSGPTVCTRECGGSAGACPASFRCAEADGRRVCIAHDDGGCAVLAPGAERASSLAPFAALLVLPMRRLRARVRAHR